MAIESESSALDIERTLAECDSNVPADDGAAAAAAFSEADMPQKIPVEGEQSNLEESTQTAAQDSGYNSSGSSHQSAPETYNEGVEGRELARTRSRASSRTSISSIPASTLTNLPDGTKTASMRDAPDCMLQPWDHPASRQVQTIRHRDATFRKLSSVRAMQMHTEDEGDDDFHLTPPKRRGSNRVSDISIRSTGSSPFKRSPFYSPTGQAGKSKFKKEYPLVLLHCSLLSPSLPVPGLVEHPDRQKILKEVLPSVYWKRWKLLEEKIGSGVLRERGVLISHPEDLYDLLEERLLESLELQHPRLDHGHFMGRDEAESDKEDRSGREDSSTEDEGDACPDCGGRVVRQNTTRKWEVKVLAANGLMRAGAWAAAWKDMEKVDVEVGLWLPPAVRANLEKRLSEESSNVDNGPSGPIALLQEPENIQTDAPARDLTPGPETVTPNYTKTTPKKEFQQAFPEAPPKSPQNETWNLNTPKTPEEIDLRTLLVNYIRVLAHDRRNIAIAFLSVLLVFLAINSRSAIVPQSDLRSFPAYIPEYPASSDVPQQQPATQTSPEHLSSQSLSGVTSESATVPTSSADDSPSDGLGGVSDALVEPSVEPEEVLSAEADSLPAENTHSTEPEGPSSIAADSLPGQITENTLSAEPEEPLSAEADSLPDQVAENSSEEYERPAHSIEIEANELPSTEEYNLSAENIESTAGEQESPASSSVTFEEPLESTDEPLSTESAHDISEEEVSQAIETTPASESTDASDGSSLPVDDSNQDEQDESLDEHEPDDENEEHKLLDI